MAAIPVLGFDSKDHNATAFLDFNDPKCEGFRDMIHFLINSRIHYALTANPVIWEDHIREFWNTATTSDDNNSIVATISGQQLTITEADVRRALQLGDDENGASMFSLEHILAVCQAAGYEGGVDKGQILKVKFCSEWKYLLHVIQHSISTRKAGWDDLPQHTASAVVGLINNEPFNLSRYIFSGLKENVAAKRSKKFLMYPRFLQLIINDLAADLPHTDAQLVIKIPNATLFRDLRRRYNPPKYTGVEVPIFDCMRDPLLPGPVAPEFVIPDQEDAGPEMEAEVPEIAVPIQGEQPVPVQVEEPVRVEQPVEVQTEEPIRVEQTTEIQGEEQQVHVDDAFTSQVHDMDLTQTSSQVLELVVQIVSNPNTPQTTEPVQEEQPDIPEQPDASQTTEPILEEQQPYIPEQPEDTHATFNIDDLYGDLGGDNEADMMDVPITDEATTSYIPQVSVASEHDIESDHEHAQTDNPSMDPVTQNALKVIDSLTEELNFKSDLIARQETEKADLHVIILQQEKSLNEKDIEISALKETIKNKDRTIEKLNQVINAKVIENENLQTVLNDQALLSHNKDLLIDDLKRQLDELLKQQASPQTKNDATNKGEKEPVKLIADVEKSPPVETIEKSPVKDVERSPVIGSWMRKRKGKEIATEPSPKKAKDLSPRSRHLIGKLSEQPDFNATQEPILPESIEIVGSPEEGEKIDALRDEADEYSEGDSIFDEEGNDEAQKLKFEEIGERARKDQTMVYVMRLVDLGYTEEFALSLEPDTARQLSAGGKPPLCSLSCLKRKCSSSENGDSGKSPCSKRRKLRMKRVIRVKAISLKLADIPPDDYSWRKYGQKPIKGSPHPRETPCQGGRHSDED